MKRTVRAGILLAALIFLAGSVLSCGSGPAETRQNLFLWDNATVYFLMTDRFSNGDTANDHAYGRGLNEDGSVNEDRTFGPGGFHGGDFAGVTGKITEGYFDALGVQAIWITPPFEQIHGARSGPGFAFYAYHGYWALDFTEPDAAYGTEADFRAMVQAAHAHNIRVLLDVVINHPGYATPEDAEAYGFGAYDSGWKAYRNGPDADLSPEAEDALVKPDSPAWAAWWGSDWVRSDGGLSGYDAGGTTDELKCLSGLPDFKNESDQEVNVPAFLAAKWQAEGRLSEETDELDAFFARKALPRTVLNYQIKWLCDWVRDYGVDGFRCDTAKNVEPAAWTALGTAAKEAYTEYQTAHPDSKFGEIPFYTVGEVWDHGVVKDKYFTETGFDALINFSFRKNAMNLTLLPDVYSYMAETLRAGKCNVLSYISSHDTALFTRSRRIDGGTALLLAPGAVQIFYGDESGRGREWPDCPYMDLTLRSSMNWADSDRRILAHFQILGQFRARHPAIGAGTHTEISSDPFVFSRVWTDASGKNTDRLIAVITQPDQTVQVPVGDVFADNVILRNAYDGKTAAVMDGTVVFSSGVAGVILLEEESNI